MTLELRSLRYLVALSQRTSYARAADDLGITQSALSRSIQSLERHFAVRLFDRGRSGVTATSAGRRIVEHAKALLASAEDLERRCREEAAGESGQLDFGMAPVPARALLAASLSDRLREAPHVRNNVVVRGFNTLLPMLIAGEIELIVAPAISVPDSPPLRVERLGRFPVSLLVRPGHPLIENGRSDRHFPFLMSNESFNSQVSPDDFLQGSKSTVHVVEDLDTLLRLTRRTDGVCLTSAFAAADELARGELCELPRSDKITDSCFDVAILSLDRRSQSVAAQNMKQSLRGNLHALTKEYRRSFPARLTI